MVAAFVPFDASHLSALALTAAAGWLLIRIGRSARGRPLARTVSGVLFGLILGAFLVDPLHHRAFGDPFLARALPLELCDAAGIAALVALATQRQLAFELAYYWGLSGTLQALVTPPLDVPLLHLDSLRYFLLHSGIVVAVLYLGPGLGGRPRRGSVARVFKLTAAYALFVGAVDWLVGANYMFLRAKPPGSVLEWFGPWPWYLLGGAAIGLFLFWLVDLPYRLTDGYREPSAARPGAAGPTPS